jgi:hypothetical protein
VLGLDTGAENLRGGKIWKLFMANPEIPKAMEAVGLV